MKKTGEDDDDADVDSSDEEKPPEDEDEDEGAGAGSSTSPFWTTDLTHITGHQVWRIKEKELRHVTYFDKLKGLYEVLHYDERGRRSLKRETAEDIEELLRGNIRILSIASKPHYKAGKLVVKKTFNQMFRGFIGTPTAKTRSIDKTVVKSKSNGSSGSDDDE